MPRQKSKKYLTVYLCAFAVILGLCISFNLVIDPFGVIFLVDLPGFNHKKAGQGRQARLSKAGVISAIKPKAIILGNSRAEYGIDPEHPGWSTRPVYNAALTDSNSYEMLRYFQHANSIQPLEQVLVMVDLPQFNAYKQFTMPDFREGRLAITLDEKPNQFYRVYDFIPTLFSLKALFESMDTLRKSIVDKQVTYLFNGQRDWHKDLLFNVANSLGGYSVIFKVEERSMIRIRAKNGDSQRIESFYKPETRVNGFDWLRRLLRIAIRDKVKVYIAINPSHARYWEMHRLMGSWFFWEEWKRELVRVVEEEGTRSGIKPFPLWDFSGFNPLSMERVPQPNDKTTKMEWYLESSHYTSALGDLLQDRIFGHHEPGRQVPDYFGVLITSRNIEYHLADLREQNLRFRELQSDVAAELKAMASEYEFADYIRDVDGNSITFKDSFKVQRGFGGAKLLELLN